MAIQILNKKELAAIRAIPLGKKHPVYQLIESLKPGEGLRIGREDFRWHRKTPNLFCIRISKKTNARFIVKNEPFRTGWTIERVE